VVRRIDRRVVSRPRRRILLESLSAPEASAKAAFRKGAAMRLHIEVVYENGVLRPLAALPARLQEHQHMTVTVEDADEAKPWLADADPTVSLTAVREALAKAPGTIAQMVHAERDER
jgi:predicted DNA-binding antitoxin AbrB/MazE fold protein